MQENSQLYVSIPTFIVCFYLSIIVFFHVKICIEVFFSILVFLYFSNSVITRDESLSKSVNISKLGLIDYLFFYNN